MEAPAAAPLRPPQPPAGGMAAELPLGALSPAAAGEETKPGYGEGESSEEGEDLDLEEDFAPGPGAATAAAAAAAAAIPVPGGEAEGTAASPWQRQAPGAALPLGAGLHGAGRSSAARRTALTVSVLERFRAKLHGGCAEGEAGGAPVSVETAIAELIAAATSQDSLARMWEGWQAWV